MENRTFAEGGTPTGRGSAHDASGVGRGGLASARLERPKVKPEVGSSATSYFRPHFTQRDPKTEMELLSFSGLPEPLTGMVTRGC